MIAEFINNLGWWQMHHIWSRLRILTLNMRMNIDSDVIWDPIHWCFTGHVRSYVIVLRSITGFPSSPVNLFFNVREYLYKCRILEARCQSPFEQRAERYASLSRDKYFPPQIQTRSKFKTNLPAIKKMPKKK